MKAKLLLSTYLSICILILLSGCQPEVANNEPLALLPSATPTTAPLHTKQPTPIPTATASPTETATAAPTVTATMQPTLVPTMPPPTATTVPPTPDLPGYPLETRTGVVEIDAVLQAIQEKDVIALTNLVQYEAIGCTHETGMGGPPKCWDVPSDELPAEGTPISAVRILGPEGMWAFPETVDGVLQELVEVTGIFAIYEAPVETETAVSRYTVLFLQNRPEPFEIQIETGIVLFRYHFSSPDDAIDQTATFLLPPQ